MTLPLCRVGKTKFPQAACLIYNTIHAKISHPICLPAMRAGERPPNGALPTVWRLEQHG
jgi:hypothetical protein